MDAFRLPRSDAVAPGGMDPPPGAPVSEGGDAVLAAEIALVSVAAVALLCAVAHLFRACSRGQGPPGGAALPEEGAALPEGPEAEAPFGLVLLRERRCLTMPPGLPPFAGGGAALSSCRGSGEAPYVEPEEIIPREMAMFRAELRCEQEAELKRAKERQAEAIWRERQRQLKEEKKKKKCLSLPRL